MQRNRPAATTCCGFTLIELLITLAVAVILLTVAVPAVQGIVQRNTITIASNQLVGALHYARSEAIRQGRDIELCKSGDGNSCSASGDWSQGWIVYVPDAVPTQNLLRAQSTLEPPLVITGNSNIDERVAFGPLGFAHGYNGTFTISSSTARHQVKIIISSTGRVRMETQ